MTEIESQGAMAVPELKPIEGKYEILEKLNEGGMGAVYKVRHRLLEETRVIKVIRPQLQSDENLRRRFLREARAAVRLRHPNIAQIYDFTVAEDGTAYMVIEFIDGVDLVQLIQQSSLPSIRLVLEIGIQSLRALAYLHRKQFVHRDISPDNLMLTKDVEGRPLVKLIDLGIAKPLQSELSLTGEGLFLGKLRYASPEQFGGRSGNEEIDHRSDLYSFGIVLYELLTAVHPITGDDNQTLLAGHLFHPPRDFAETDPQGRVPERLRSIVLKSLEKSAADRFPDADAFSKSLADFAAEWSESASAPASLDATVIKPQAGAPAGRPGSTQDRLDLEFAPQPTPPPRPLGVVSPPQEDQREALLQSCCEKIEGLIAAKMLLEAEVELQRGEENLGRSILLDDLGKKVRDLRGKVNESIVRARLLLREGDFEAALAQLEEAQEIDVESPEVSALSDEIQESLARRNREIENARHAIEVQLEAGQPQEALKRLHEAQEVYGRFARLEGLHERVESLVEAAARIRRIAEAANEVGRFIEQGKLHRATAALTAALRTHGEDEMFAELAEQITKLEAQERERERLAREAERRRQVNSQLELAQQQIEAENYERALELLKQAARLDPDDPQIEAKRRWVQGAHERREQLQRRALELESLREEIEALLERGDLDKVNDLVAAAEADHGELPELAALRVRLDEMRLEQREKAAGELLKEAYRCFESGQLKDAAGRVEQALALSPALPQASKLHQKIVERRREESRLQALEAARGTILKSLNLRKLDEAEKALQTARQELGSFQELKTLERRLRELRARERRDVEVQNAAQRIDKLIQKNRFGKASEALADAVRAHGRDPVFDELRTRIEEMVGREQAAKEILVKEIPRKKPFFLSRPGWYIAAALLLVTVAIVVYLVWPRAVATSGPAYSRVVPVESAKSLDDLLEGRTLGGFYALIVGNNTYQRGLPDLETAVNDARQVAATLESRYGFETNLLLNATRYDTLAALEGYIDRLSSDDNLLVFYAGHGFVDQVTGRGYWQPTDAEPENTANWISSLEVSDILLDVPAQRALVVADSCFSGAFAENGSSSVERTTAQSSPEEIIDRLELRARRVLSSGNLLPVLDNGADGHSVFSRALLAALDESPGAIESNTLFERVRERVSAATVGKELQQRPQFAPLESDKGGVFLFVPAAESTS